jgi:hypothetical protein
MPDRVTAPASPSLEESRHLLVEYLETLDAEKHELFTEGAFDDESSPYRASLKLWGKLYANGVRGLSDDEFAYVISELRRRVEAGTAPALIVQAFIVWHRSWPERRRQAEDEARQVVQESGLDQLALERAKQNSGTGPKWPRHVREAVDAVLAESAAPVAVVPPNADRLQPGTSARQGRPRARRSRTRRTPDRPEDPEPPPVAPDGPPAARPAPAIVIRVALEEPVHVTAAWEHAADGARLRDWLQAHPELADLVNWAVELAGVDGEAA